MKLEVSVDRFTGQTRLRDKESRRFFSRVVAGLCWPQATKPGAVLALAEDAVADPVDGYRVLRLAGFEQHADVEQLLELAAGLAPLGGEWAGRSAISVWLGNPFHPFAKRIRIFNERLTSQGQRRIHLRAAPGVNAGGQLHADLMPYLSARWVGRSALVLERRELLAMVEDAGRDIRRPIEDFPAVAALMWCVAYCDDRRASVGTVQHQPGTADDVAGY